MVTTKKKGTKKYSKKSASFSDNDSMVFEIELELSKLKREKSVIVLNKAIFLYFFFIFFAVISLLTGFVAFFNLLVVMGLLSVIIGSIPYINTMYSEEKNLKDMITRLKKMS